MNALELTISVSEEYDTSFQRARTVTDFGKCRCWFDRKNLVSNAVTVKLTAQGISIAYFTPNGLFQESCSYDAVLSVTELHDGIMLRLSHKRLLFLRAADNRKDTELLMQAAIMLESHCKYIIRKSYLCIGKAGLLAQIKFRLRPRQGHYDGSGNLKIGLILLICAAIFIATVFVLQPINNRKIAESEAVSLVATYSGCEPSRRRGNIRYIDLQFSDHGELTVDGTCSNSGLVAQLDRIPAGTELHLLVHPQSDNILQITAKGDILLEFHDAQNRIWREAVAFAVIGLFLYAAAIVLSVKMIRKKL